MAVETYGSGIPKLVEDQLKARETLFSQANKSIQQIQAINSNVAWVKLRSSVNVDTGETKEVGGFTSFRGTRKKKKIYSPDLAKSYVLIGGTQTANLGARAGVNTSLNFDPNSAYNTSTRLGTRPMPGITGFSVASKGTLGTLQQAEVEFVVWDKNQLQEIEQLYFRPGYSVLLEWGHSVYITDDGNTKLATSDSTINDKLFFDTQKIEEIEKLIFQKKQTTDGNYDGMFGLITNFNWSFREDGGYNCSIKVVSKGVVLESISLGKVSDAFTITEDDDNEETSRKNKSIFHYIYEALKKGLKGDKVLLNSKDLLKEAEVTDVDLNQFDILKIQYNIGDTAIGRGLRWFFNLGDNNVLFVPLRSFLDIYNKYILTKAYTGEGDNKESAFVQFDLDSQEKYYTFKGHYSADPGTSFPVNTPVGDPYVNYKLDINGKRNKDKTNLKNHTKYAKGKENLILDLAVNTEVILSAVETILDSPQDDGVGAFDLLKNVLSSVQRALGDLNSFEVMSGETKEGVTLYRIIDTENLSKSKDIPPKINLTGLKSTVVNIDMSSAISSEIASQVAISAQASGGDQQKAIGALLDWNEGLIDRHAEIKAPTKKTKEEIEAEKKAKEKEKERKQKARKLIDKAYTRLTKLKIYGQADFDTAFSEIIAEINAASSFEQPDFTGIIPIELSIKMLGISGFKIGTSFTINSSMLPVKYDNNFAFIITGLDHEIGSDNKWYTNVKTLFYPIANPTPKTNDDIDDSSADDSSVEDQTQDETQDEPTVEEQLTTPNADRLRNTLRTLGYSEKGDELSNGGDITSECADMGIAVSKTIKSEIPSLNIVFTGGNDSYHQKLAYNSRHKQGVGLDFVIAPANSTNVQKVKEIIQGYAAGNQPYFSFIDEYADPTKAATGKHFHISWRVGTEGKNAIAEAIRLANKGKIKKYTV